ncbi:MAG TPA: YicC/YloC family endoribonuclease [Hyphomicrobium sp.]
MSIKSMTGFSRVEGAVGSAAWHWELRSVNARGLDLRLRLPSGMEALEPKVREAVARHLVRGSITVSLNVESRAAALQVRLNEEALAQAVKAAEHIRALTEASPPSADGLMAIKGVLEVVEAEESAEEAEERVAAMLESLEQALRALVQARLAEGARLKAVLVANLAEIDRLVGIVETSPARTPAAIAARLKEQVARLMESANTLDPDRLHQEAVLVATRVDVEEELKRLRAHIAAAHELLEAEGAVGRNLDFLAQEFNREANTLCSKANDVDITRAGLALKTVIDQMREQVQNIE